MPCTPKDSSTAAFLASLQLDATRPPESNAFVRALRIPRPGRAMKAIEARLASEPWDSLTREAVEDVLRHWNVRPTLDEKHAVALFRRALESAIAGGTFAAVEHGALARLATLLAVSDARVELEQGQAAEACYRSAVKVAAEDRVLSPEEREALETLASESRLPADRVVALRREVLQPIVEGVFQGKIAARRYSPDDQAELERLANDLGILLDFDETTKHLLERFRTLWVIEHGQLPTVDVPIHLQAGEACHWTADASLHEFRTVTTRVSYGGPSTRIRIARGFYWNVGSYSVNRSTSNVLKLLGTGTLYVTSKRLLFVGDGKTTAIPLKRILEFTMFKDGVRIQKDSGRDQLFQFKQFDGEMLGVILGAAIDRS